MTTAIDEELPLSFHRYAFLDESFNSRVTIFDVKRATLTDEILDERLTKPN
jgi:hypothetical protein